MACTAVTSLQMNAISQKRIFNLNLPYNIFVTYQYYSLPIALLVVGDMHWVVTTEFDIFDVDIHLTKLKKPNPGPQVQAGGRVKV